MGYDGADFTHVSTVTSSLASVIRIVSTLSPTEELVEPVATMISVATARKEIQLEKEIQEYKLYLMSSCFLRVSPISHLIPVDPDGQEQLSSTQVPPFKQEKSLGQTKQ